MYYNHKHNSCKTIELQWQGKDALGYNRHEMEAIHLTPLFEIILRFLEKWNKSKKKYKYVCYFADYKNYGICYTRNHFWADNNTGIFTNSSGVENEHFEGIEFYKLKITKNNIIMKTYK